MKSNAQGKESLIEGSEKMGNPISYAVHLEAILRSDAIQIEIELVATLT